MPKPNRRKTPEQIATKQAFEAILQYVLRTDAGWLESAVSYLTHNEQQARELAITTFANRYLPSAARDAQIQLLQSNNQNAMEQALEAFIARQTELKSLEANPERIAGINLNKIANPALRAAVYVLFLTSTPSASRFINSSSTLPPVTLHRSAEPSAAASPPEFQAATPPSAPTLPSSLSAILAAGITMAHSAWQRTPSFTLPGAAAQSNLSSQQREEMVRKLRQNGNTPLHIAAVMGDLAAIENLLKNPETNPNEQNAPNIGHDSPLHAAIRFNRTEATLRLLQHPKINPNIGNIDGNPPLHYAIKLNSIPIIKALLNHKKTNPNAQNKKLETPLHRAMLHKHNDVAEILLEKGADPAIPNNQGIAPVHFAAQFNNVKFLEMLIRKNKPALNHRTKSGTTNGATPLHFAAFSGCVEAVKCLLPYVDLEVRDALHKKTALEAAVENGHSEIAALIFEEQQRRKNLAAGRANPENQPKSQNSAPEPEFAIDATGTTWKVSRNNIWQARVARDDNDNSQKQRLTLSAM